MKKEIIVLGDVEMGAGNLTDDFISDSSLTAMIEEQARKEHPVDLVFNGDTFDFLKCPGRLQPSASYPRHISKEVSLAKLRLIYEAHKTVFEVLKKFVSREGHHLYFVLGNHDHDLVYPEVRQEIKRLLGSEEKVSFPGLAYASNGVYVEHGHQHDLLFSINFEKLFLKHKGRSILNFPYVSFGLISLFMRYKEEHPFVERIFPRPALFSHHKVIARKMNYHTLSYFLKSLFYYPFRYYSDPTYSMPTGLIREFYKRLKTFHWDVDNIASVFMHKKIKHKIIVLGHIHEKMTSRGRNRIIIHPGTWRDEYDFNAKTRELVPRSKRYVSIIIQEDGRLDYKLIDIRQPRKILYFDEVIRNERKFLHQAAQEEKYTLNI